MKNWKQLNGKKWGPLNGVYVKKPIHDDLYPFFNEFGLPDGVSQLLDTVGNVFRTSMAMFKVGKVSLNPPTMIRNAGANVIFLWGSGISPKKLIWDLVPEALGHMVADSPNSIAYKLYHKAFPWVGDKYDKNRIMYADAVRHGIFKTNWTENEMTELLTALKSLDPNDSKLDRGWNNALQFLGKVSGFYGKIDDLFKFAKFIEQKRMGKSSGEAATDAHFWVDDYSLVPIPIKAARQFVMPFATFNYKSIPKLAKIATTRPWVMAALSAVPWLTAEYYRKQFNVTDEEWDQLMQSLPSYARESRSLLVLPYKSPEGNVQWVDFSFFMPWGNLLAGVKAIEHDDWAELLRTIGIGNPIMDIGFMLFSWKDGPPKDLYSMREIYNRLDSNGTKAYKLVNWLWMRFGPGAISERGALGLSLNIGNKDAMDREITATQAISRWFGVNIYAPTPLQGRIETKAKLNDLDSDLYKALKDPNLRLDNDDTPERRKRKSKKIQEYVNEYMRQRMKILGQDKPMPKTNPKPSSGKPDAGKEQNIIDMIRKNKAAQGS